MIINNKEDEYHIDYDKPLHLVLGSRYKYFGNIIVELNEEDTMLYMDLPYASRETGILFKLFFFEKLNNLLNKVNSSNHYIFNNHSIVKKVLVKNNTDSKIVLPKEEIICTLNKGWYNFATNTFNFSIKFYASMKESIAQILEDEYYDLLNVFRKEILDA